MKIRIKFRKQGAMKFVGHLDIMRYFQKVMRRAEVDIRYSGGYSPHQIMSFAAPLGVGLTSNGEYVDIEVNSTGDSKAMLSRINAANVEGIEAVSYRKLPDTAKNAMSLVAAADYTVWVKDGYAPEEDAKGQDGEDSDREKRFWDRFVEFTGREAIEVVKKTKKGERALDLKPYIYEARVCRMTEEPERPGLFVAERSGDGKEDGDPALRTAKPAVFLKLAAGSAVNIKPELVIGAFCEYMGKTYPEFAFQIQREEVYAEEAFKTADEAEGDKGGSDEDREEHVSGRLIPLVEYGEDIE